MFQVSPAHTAMRPLLRASWWIALCLVVLLPLLAAVVPGLTWPDVAVMDLLVVAVTGLVLLVSRQARSGIRMLPALMARPRPRRTGGLTAAHLSW